MRKGKVENKCRGVYEERKGRKEVYEERKGRKEV